MAVQTSYGTTLTKAIEGALADNGPHDVVPMVNGEASAQIAFGRGVVYGSEDGQAVLPSADSDKLVGITVKTDQYSAEELGAVGMKPGAVMSVLRKGRIWAMARTAVSPGDRLWVRAVSSETSYEKYGGLEDADDGSDTIDAQAEGEWLTTAAQGELAVLAVNFT